MSIYILDNNMSKNISSYSDNLIGITINNCIDIISYKYIDLVKSVIKDDPTLSSDDMDKLLDMLSIFLKSNKNRASNHYSLMTKNYNYELYLLELASRLILEYEFRFNREFKKKNNFLELTNTASELLIYLVVDKSEIYTRDLVGRLGDHYSILKEYSLGKSFITYYDTQSDVSKSLLVDIYVERNKYRAKSKKFTFTNREIPPWLSLDSNPITIELNRRK